MTLEQISEKIRDHLLAQRAQSEFHGACLYRDRAGRMCAVGCLIPDEKYHAWMEGTSGCGGKITNIISDALDYSGPTNNLVPILLKWQKYHDDDSCQKGGYKGWLDGLDGALSPEEFHRSMFP